MPLAAHRPIRVPNALAFQRSIRVQNSEELSEPMIDTITTWGNALAGLHQLYRDAGYRHQELSLVPSGPPGHERLGALVRAFVEIGSRADSSWPCPPSTDNTWQSVVAWPSSQAKWADNLAESVDRAIADCGDALAAANPGGILGIAGPTEHQIIRTGDWPERAMMTFRGQPRRQLAGRQVSCWAARLSALPRSHGLHEMLSSDSAFNLDVLGPSVVLGYTVGADMGAPLSPRRWYFVSEAVNRTREMRQADDEILREALARRDRHERELNPPRMPSVEERLAEVQRELAELRAVRPNT